jgi:hypothetical protein
MLTVLTVVAMATVLTVLTDSGEIAMGLDRELMVVDNADKRRLAS